MIGHSVIKLRRGNPYLSVHCVLGLLVQDHLGHKPANAGPVVLQPEAGQLALHGGHCGMTRLPDCLGLARYYR